MSSSDAEPAPSAGVFHGLTFLVHGHQGKRTKALMTKFIELHGGAATRHASSDYLGHLVCERDLFAQHSASTPDPVFTEVLKTNEQKRKETGPDQKPQRVWILPPDWVEACVKNGRRLDEDKWDLTLNADAARAPQGAASTSNRKKDKSGGGKRKRSEADSRQVKKKRETQHEPKPQTRASSSSSASTKTSSSKTIAGAPDRHDEKPDLDRPLSASQPKVFTSTLSSKSVPESAPMVGGKPEAKPAVVSVSRTFIKPASSQQQQQPGQKKKGMWGGIQRALPKQPGVRIPPVVEASGDGDGVKDVKGKGKARAAESEEPDEDDDALEKVMEKMADGAAFDDSGLSSLEDDSD